MLKKNFLSVFFSSKLLCPNHLSTHRTDLVKKVFINLFFLYYQFYFLLKKIIKLTYRESKNSGQFEHLQNLNASSYNFQTILSKTKKRFAKKCKWLFKGLTLQHHRGHDFAFSSCQYVHISCTSLHCSWYSQISDYYF